MNVALIYGGRSAEHEVSISSAKTIEAVLIQNSHTLFPIAIDRAGRWFLQEQVSDTITTKKPLWIIPGQGVSSQEGLLPIDVSFPTTHGWGGEDGNLQGLLTLAKIPFAGCDTASSAIGMHKALAQRIFAEAGIPTVPTVVVDYRNTFDETLYDECIQRFGSSLFIKPENTGSSVGITALREADLSSCNKAIEYALTYSERVLIQPYYTEVIEVECGIIQGPSKRTVPLGPGVVCNPQSEAFLSYAQKYAPQGGAYLKLPSELPAEIEEEIRFLAIKAFEAIKGSGYARVDFFLVDDKVILNEINTLPGLTQNSHWPKLLRFEGYSLEEAIDHLLEQAINTFNRIWNVRTSYE